MRAHPQEAVQIVYALFDGHEYSNSSANHENNNNVMRRLYL